MSGVTFMSALACGISPVTTRSAPKCLCACFITCLLPWRPASSSRSVMRPMSSIPTLRRSSIAAMIAE